MYCYQLRRMTRWVLLLSCLLIAVAFATPSAPFLSAREAGSRAAVASSGPDVGQGDDGRPHLGPHESGTHFQVLTSAAATLQLIGLILLSCLCCAVLSPPEGYRRRPRCPRISWSTVALSDAALFHWSSFPFSPLYVSSHVF